MMAMPNQTWTHIVTEANQNRDSLFNPQTVKTLAWVLAINNKAAQALGQSFAVQLSRIFVEMLHIYKIYSTSVSNEIQTKVACTRPPCAQPHSCCVRLCVPRTLAQGKQYKLAAHVKQMRSVKKAALKLVQQFIENSQSSDIPVVVGNLLPALMEPVLDDYLVRFAPRRAAPRCATLPLCPSHADARPQKCDPDAREAEVLELFSEVRHARFAGRPSVATNARALALPARRS